MIEFTRCPKCSTLYEIDGVNLNSSSGWVQCGDCSRKFKAANHQVELDELSFVTVSNFNLDQSMKMEGAVAEELVETSMQVVEEDVVDESVNNINHDNTRDDDQNSEKKNKKRHSKYESSKDESKNLVLGGSSHSQLSEKLDSEDSEFLERTIILPNEVGSAEDDDGNYEFIFNNYSDDIFDPALIDEDVDPREIEATINRGSRSARRSKKNSYAELHSEFSEEEIEIESQFSEKTILEEELETNTVSQTLDESLVSKQEHSENNLVKGLMTMLSVAGISCLVLALIGLFALQIHSRGTMQWIPQNNYDYLISKAPILANFEKSQIDLSAIHLASTRMEVNPDDIESRIITLQLINRSYTNQAYPDFQLEFTDAQGDTIARKIVLPSLYLQKDHLGLLEPRQAKIVYLTLKALPDAAVGYQIKVVQQRPS